MTDLFLSARRPSLPFIGPFVRGLAVGRPKALGILFMLLILTVLALAVKTWGPVALSLTALAAVPVIFAILILITLGK